MHYSFETCYIYIFSDLSKFIYIYFFTYIKEKCYSVVILAKSSARPPAKNITGNIPHHKHQTQHRNFFLLFQYTTVLRLVMYIFSDFSKLIFYFLTYIEEECYSVVILAKSSAFIHA